MTSTSIPFFSRVNLFGDQAIELVWTGHQGPHQKVRRLPASHPNMWPGQQFPAGSRVADRGRDPLVTQDQAGGSFFALKIRRKSIIKDSIQRGKKNLMDDQR